MSKQITVERFLKGIQARKAGKSKNKLDLEEFLDDFSFMCAMSETDDPYVKAAKDRYAVCEKYLTDKSKSNDISFILTCLILTNHEHDWVKTDYLYKSVKEGKTVYDALPAKSIDTVIEKGPIELLDSGRIEMYNRMLLVRGPNNERIPYDDYPLNHLIIAMLAVTNHIIQLDCSPETVIPLELSYISSVINPCIIFFCDKPGKQIVVKTITGKKFDINKCNVVEHKYPYTKTGLIRSIIDVIACESTATRYTDKQLDDYAKCL